MDLKELKDYFNKNIPQKKKPYISFFEITRYPHYENVLSNILSFYFDCFEEHNLEYLFFESLLSLVPEHNLKYTKFEVKREYKTDKGNRIDLLIINEYDEEMKRSSDESFAIILENKIYASLYNDLDDYWNSIKIPENRKIGIVLSKNQINTNNRNFINITLIDFIKAIENRIGKYLYKASDKHIIFVKELINSIKNLYWDLDMNDEIEFTMENKSKILDSIKLMENLRTFIEMKIESFSINLGKERGATRSSEYKYIFLDENKYFSFTVYYGTLLYELDNSIHAILEYYGPDKDYIKKIRNNSEIKNEFYDLNFNVWHEESQIAFIEFKVSSGQIINLDLELKKIYSIKFENFYNKLKNAV